MALNEDFLLELKERNPIEDVVSSYVSIKKGGRNPKALCPFHNEKPLPSPSIPKTAPFTALAAEPAEMSSDLSD